MSVRLTESLVKSLRPPEQGNRITYDAELTGFGVRVTAKGAKAFILNYRSDGRERRFTIGGYPEWSATAARTRAETLKRQIDLGDDPMGKRREERAALSISALCDLYIERHLPKKRPTSQRDDLSMINTIITPRLGTLKINAVRHSDIDALHRDLSKQAPFRANRVVALLSKMFALAIKWDLRSGNPAQGIERNPESPRSKYLDADELLRLAATLEHHPSQSVANAIRLLLLTGARRTEVLSATWTMFDLESGLWTKPKENVKQKREHRIPLSVPALSLLVELEASRKSHPNPSPYLFPNRSGTGHIPDIKKGWAAIQRRANLPGFRLHDLRHTYASYLASSGYSLPIIGALLGHTQPQTTQRYSHLLDASLRTATDHAGRLLSFKSALNEDEAPPAAKQKPRVR